MSKQRTDLLAKKVEKLFIQPIHDMDSSLLSVNEAACLLKSHHAAIERMVKRELFENPVLGYFKGYNHACTVILAALTRMRGGAK